MTIDNIEIIRDKIKSACRKVTMQKVYGWISALWIILIFMYGCQKDDALKAVATVNGERVTLGDFRERFTNTLSFAGDRSSLKPEDYDRLREEVLKVMIDEKIMLLRAGELKLSVSDAELTKRMEEIKEGYSPDGFEKILATQKVHNDAWNKALKTFMIIEKLMASDLYAGISVTEEEAREYYHGHRRQYVPEEKVHIVQIVLRDREKARNILNRLKRGEDFGKVAREVSIGPEAIRGGDLGFVSRGIMPEAIDSVIFSLPSGTISQVIKSPYGYHILRIVEKEQGKKEFSDIKERIIWDIRKQKEEQAYVPWLSSLQSRAVIKIDRDLLGMGTVPAGRQTE
jgi:parvulin-like peptidyl-prolyl isomerase